MKSPLVLANLVFSGISVGCSSGLVGNAPSDHQFWKVVFGIWVLSLTKSPTLHVLHANLTRKVPSGRSRPEGTYELSALFGVSSMPNQAFL